MAERAESRHEEGSVTQESCLPACALDGHSDRQIPDYRPGGDTGGGAAVENGLEKRLLCMHLQFTPSWFCLT